MDFAKTYFYMYMASTTVVMESHSYKYMSRK